MARQPFGYGGFNKPGGMTAVKPQPPGPSPSSRPRDVRCTQFFFSNMPVAFTGSAGENANAGTFIEQFPMAVRGAWSNLTDARVRLTEASSGSLVSSEQVPILGLAGNSDLVFPLYYWKKPLLLPPNAQLRGDFINDGGEEAGNLVFFVERPDLEIRVPVRETKEFRLLLNLGLESADTTTVLNAQTQQVDYDLLVYGALSTSTGCEIRFLDTRQNINWSAQKLPIGAFAGIVGNPQPIMRYDTPYYLPRNTAIRAEYVNTGAETGKFVEFICERILY